MDGFERRKERKKESIRQASVELFKAFGFQKVTIQDIAKKAGVSPATIYNHFGSKEGLVRDVVKRLLLETMEKYLAIMEGDRPFPEKLDLIIFDKTELSRQYEGELIQAVASSDPEIRNLVESLAEKALEGMARLYEEGKRLGYVNPELSRESILLYIDVLRHGFMARADVFAAPERNARLIRELSSLYLYGLLGKRE